MSNSLGVQIISCLLHTDQRAKVERYDTSARVAAYRRLDAVERNNMELKYKIHNVRSKVEDLFKEFKELELYCKVIGVDFDDILDVSRPQENEHYVINKVSAYKAVVEKGWCTADELMTKLIVKNSTSRPIRSINLTKEEA